MILLPVAVPPFSDGTTYPTVRSVFGKPAADDVARMV